MDIGTDTRDRVIRMEAEVREVTKDIQEIKSTLNELNQVFQQAKGAKWLILTSAALASFVTGMFSFFVTNVFGIMK